MSNLELITNKNNDNDDNNQNKMHFENYHQLMMYYQTSIRNVAGTTALSFAALGYSRFYRGKSKLYISIIMVIVSLLILTCSFLFNLFLYYDIQLYIDNPKFKIFDKWLKINELFVFIHILTLFFAIYTFYRVFIGNTF